MAAVVRSHGDLRRLLEAIAATIAQDLGFTALVVNVYRPAWDDYEVVVVEDPDEASREQLIGSTVSPVDLERLRRFADLVRACSREGDAAVRLGGEEFALVLSGVGEREALAVAERLRREVANEFREFPASTPYRGALTASEARAELLRGVGTQFDAVVVEAFLRVLDGA